ncbi:MAG: YdcF family protein [Chloroflexota bacterium]
MVKRKWLGAIGLAVFLTLATLVAIDQYGLVDRAQPADVIVVLGSRVQRDGRLSPSLSRRARWAAELYNRGLAPVIICSGGLGENPPTEAEAACSLIQSLGVPQSAIVLETQARSTEETSLYVAAIMRARGWDSAVVVSDGYHLARTAMLFSRASVVVYPSPAQQLSGPMRPVERFMRGGRELAAILWYWFKTVLGLPITDFQ